MRDRRWDERGDEVRAAYWNLGNKERRLVIVGLVLCAYERGDGDVAELLRDAAEIERWVDTGRCRAEE